MDNLEFREFGKQMIDFIADYFATIEQRAIKPSVKPGFLLKKLPTSAPKEGEDFSQIFDDYEKHVLPGICGWNSPNFHAYFPASISYPSILGELMAAATGGVGFEWSVNPSYTELEIVVTEWLGKMLGLPKEFLATDPCQGKDGKRGGGVVQGAASESVVVAMLAARKAALDRLQEQYPNESEASLMGKLVAYSSILSHSSIEKATLVCYNKLRLIETDDQGVLDSDLLSRTIKEDVESGLCPFFFCANLGTTMVCSFDNLEEIGPLCQQWNMWLHVDAAYAGTFFVCPEFRTYLKGIEFADSFNFNAHKLMLTNFDCSPFWVKDRNLLMNALSVERSYFTNDDTGVVTDFRKWQIPLGRRFRALKLWFVLRSYGQKGVQRHVREHLQRTKLFEDLMAVDSRFEFWPRTPNLGLVCFRLKGPDKLTKMLSDRISNSGKIALSTVVFKNKTIIRFHGGLGNDKHVRYAWNVIQNETDRLLIKPNISSL